MARGKSEFKFKCDKDTGINIVTQFLQVNKAEKIISRDGTIVYRFHDLAYVGSLEYGYKDGYIIIYAYLGYTNKPILLDDKFAGCIPKGCYKTFLAPLFDALTKASEQGTSITQEPTTTTNVKDTTPQAQTAIVEEVSKETTTSQVTVQSTPVTPEVKTANPVSQTSATTYFTDVNTSKKDNYAIAAFIISLVAFILSIFGVIFGLPIILVEYCLAAQGLKGSKRGFAIAAIVLATISIIITIINFIAYIATVAG